MWLVADNTIYPHNGIFVVNNADRLRIDDQWTGTVGAPPSTPSAVTTSSAAARATMSCTAATAPTASTAAPGTTLRTATAGDRGIDALIGGTGSGALTAGRDPGPGRQRDGTHAESAYPGA